MKERILNCLMVRGGHKNVDFLDLIQWFYQKKYTQKKNTNRCKTNSFLSPLRVLKSEKLTSGRFHG